MEVQQDKPFIIAYYLPQYHPIPENDEWWGKGFTEWTNVAKAKPLFKGHYQPKIPADLGFYDLRVPEVREQQAELAREAGVDGFCYWHYWFGNGKELLERPFKEVVESGKPDFPFCLGWANESWEAKIWSTDGKHKAKQILMQQTYPGSTDNEKHFYEYKKAFQDKRYLTHDSKPLFLIYKPLKHPQITEFLQQWNTLIKQNNIAQSFYFIGVIESPAEYSQLKEIGFDAITLKTDYRIYQEFSKKNKICQILQDFIHRHFHKPIVLDYKKAIKHFWKKDFDILEDVIPTILPNWDHSPRSGDNAIVLKNSTPQNFKVHCLKILKGLENKENKVCFLKSWNEWGEGNYMEPDLKYGKDFIKSLKQAIIHLEGL